MSDAWIVGEDEGSVSETCRAVAELGFRPLRVHANGTLAVEQGAPAGRAAPDIAIVLGDANTVGELRAATELRDVPVVLTLNAEQLDGAGSLLDVDELLVEPYAQAELKMRITRARKQVNGIHADDIVRIGTGLEIDLATYQVSLDGAPVDFTYMEYELLRFLATHPNRVFTREALLTSVWNYDYYGGARTVDVHVRRVRAKLGAEHAQRLVTVRSVGYRFEVS